MLMTQILKICLVLVFSLSLTGCHIVWEEPKPCIPEIQIQDKLIYLDKPIPEIQEPPIALKYKVEYIKYNDVTYYQLTLEDGEILKLNYERYKSWAQTNYKIIKTLKTKKD
jgi:hypothetical protein